ncbi:hypothetical protein ACHAW5_004321 [Stephanodiscus triporus]|uniref:Uncharacterized protein n=1 Tax=Stephanodiscus triporus TaxID=2934178 RepID=A0ABD3N0P0_9STRA
MNTPHSTADDNYVSVVGVGVSAANVADEAAVESNNSPKDESLRPPPDSLKKLTAPETPRWRFVNKAKKTEGYSSSAAGTFVRGISGRTLVDKYNATVLDCSREESKDSADASRSEWEMEVGGGEDGNSGKPGRLNGIKRDENVETFGYAATNAVKEKNDDSLCVNEMQEEEPALVIVEVTPSLEELASLDLEKESLEEPMSHIPLRDSPSNLEYAQRLSRHPEQTEDYCVDIPPSGITAPSQNKPSKKGRSVRQVGGAAVAGTVAGIVVAGPIVGVAAGGAAAYTAARVNNPVGDAARKSGEAVACAGDKAKEVNDKHELTKKTATMAKSAMNRAKELDEKHKIVANTKMMANSALNKAKEVDEKHRVVEKSKEAAHKVAVTARNVDEKHQVISKSKVAASNVIAKAKDVNEKHHVTEKTKTVAKLTMKQMALGVKSISKAMGGDKKDDGMSNV